MTNETPATSWNTDGIKSRLVVAGLVAEVEPNADHSGWLWAIRGQRARRTTGFIKCTHTSLVSMRAAQIEAEAALRDIATRLLAVVGKAA